MNVKKKNALFGRYPSCDLLNNALRFLREGETDAAVEEIIFAIEKAGGYFHEDNIQMVEEALGRKPYGIIAIFTAPLMEVKKNGRH